MTLPTPLAALLREVGHVADYAKRCGFYGPADALREHLAALVAAAKEVEALSLLPPAQGKVGKFDVSNCRQCGQFMGHGHECAAPPLPVDREQG